MTSEQLTHWQEIAAKEDGFQLEANRILQEGQIEYERANLRAWFARQGYQVHPVFAGTAEDGRYVFKVEGLLMAFGQLKRPIQYLFRDGNPKGEFKLYPAYNEEETLTIADLGRWEV